MHVYTLLYASAACLVGLVACSVWSLKSVETTASTCRICACYWTLQRLIASASFLPVQLPHALRLCSLESCASVLAFRVCASVRRPRHRSCFTEARESDERGDPTDNSDLYCAERSLEGLSQSSLVVKRLCPTVSTVVQLSLCRVSDSMSPQCGRTSSKAGYALSLRRSQLGETSSNPGNVSSLQQRRRVVSPWSYCFCSGSHSPNLSRLSR